MENIVMLHEIWHDILHRREAVKAGGFKEFNIFNMQESRMEYEANVFASQVSLDDEEILEYIRYGYDIQQIASAMHPFIVGTEWVEDFSAVDYDREKESQVLRQQYLDSVALYAMFCWIADTP